MANRKGNVEFLERQIEAMAKDPRKATKKKQGKFQTIKRTRKTKLQDQREHLSELEKHIKKETQMTNAALARVLGPSGLAQAVKVSKMDASAFNASDVAAFLAGGWGVEPANTSPGRAGGILGGYFPNPDPLGPVGFARSLVLVGPVDVGMVTALRQAGFDVSAAPKKYREANVKKNPMNKKTLKRAGKVALTESRQLLGTGLQSIGRIMESAGSLAKPKRNPEPKEIKAAMKKAKAWFGNDELVTEPELIDWKPPSAVVHIGRMVAIEYESDKFDGTRRVYRHEVTQFRELLLSPDGTCLIVLPGFKVTKRGIEG